MPEAHMPMLFGLINLYHQAEKIDDALLFYTAHIALSLSEPLSPRYATALKRRKKVIKQG